MNNADSAARTEREKMEQGTWYRGSTPSLMEERQAAKELLYDFNQLRPCQQKEREELLRKLFGKVGSGVWVEPPFACDYGSNMEIGDRFYANHGCVILDCARVTIGDNVLFGPQVGIYTAGHAIDAERRRKGVEYALPITIGDGVWIGGGSVVLPGVTIGQNSVIGAGSVVTRDIPAGVIAVGNPCRVLRPVTEEDRDRIPGKK